MYVGRDATALSMIKKTEWTDKELAYFHFNLSQMAPYLNAEGVKIHQEIIEEIEHRGGLKHETGDYSHGTRLPFD